MNVDFTSVLSQSNMEDRGRKEASTKDGKWVNDGQGVHLEITEHHFSADFHSPPPPHTHIQFLFSLFRCKSFGLFALLFLPQQN